MASKSVTTSSLVSSQDVAGTAITVKCPARDLTKPTSYGFTDCHVGENEQPLPKHHTIRTVHFTNVPRRACIVQVDNERETKRAIAEPGDDGAYTFHLAETVPSRRIITIHLP